MKRKLLLASLLCALIGTANAQSVSTATYGNASDSSTRTLAVSLNYPTEPDFVAFALQLDLPEGTTVTDVKAMAPLKNGETIDLSAKGGSTTESTDFKVPFQQNGTKCNIVGYNFGNKAIGGESGDVLLAVTLNVEDEKAFNETQITTSSSFVDSEAEESPMADNKTSEEVARLWGDVLMDGTVDGKDIQAVANIFSGKTNSGTIDKFAGDITGEGVIDGKDIQAVANIFSGKNK